MINATLRRLMAPYRTRLIWAIGLQAVAGACSLLPWVLLAQLAEPHASASPPMLWATLFSLMAWLTCQAIALHLTHLIDIDLSASLRQRLVDHLQALPLVWFHQHSQDEVARLVEHDVTALHQLVAHAPANLTNLIVVPLLVALYLAWLNIWLFLLGLIPLLLALVCYRLIRGAPYRDIMAQRDQALATLSSQYGAFAQNLLLVRQYPNAGIQQQLSQSAQAFEQAFIGWVKKVGRPAAIAETLLSSPWLVAWLLLAVWLIQSSSAHTLPAAVFCAFVLLLRAMAAPIHTMGHSGDALAHAQAAADRIEALLAQSALAEGQSPRRPIDASIQVQHLSFDHRSNQILADVNFSLAPGRFTALVGPSGCGKTTLLHLLARFMDPSCGQITLGGVVLADLPTSVRHQTIAIALQQAAALDLSMADNIALLAPNTTLADIKHAAQDARLDATISAWPNGYQSIANQDVILSGGERQRLALARLFLSTAPIVLLDEPTSALDAQTAHWLHHKMRQRFQDKTVLISSHRLQEVCHADHILVLDQGRLIEQGRHQDLLAHKGLYFKLWQEQQEPSEDAV